MLSVVYKLISKLLATRLSPHSKHLIRPQQTGFIPGRFILENVSLAWLTHDWVTKHNQPTLFLKLDFEKASDRVEHPSIWAVLERIGLGGTFLMLGQGLLMGASPKVHINGSFTEEIPVTRGVRQGDPLSPLLFALTTQPLMEYLEFKLASGDINGVKISEDLTICHRLFADDVGIFILPDESSFKKLQEALHLYELASGAKLNLAKSVIIPLALPSIPQWLRDTGCTINKPGEIQKYLGALRAST